MRVVFSYEKLFDIDDVYNVQNDRVWAPSGVEVNKSDGVKAKRKFPTKGHGLGSVHVRKVSPH